jgi:hypothetical protein
MSSGSGDIGGEVSGEEAAWRDLIARFDTPGDQSVATPWPASEDLPNPDQPTANPASSATDSSAADGDGAAERARIIRYAADPRSYSPPEEQDEPYVPAPLPLPARLDALSKAAWAALICGPGYLLIGTMLGWTISGTEALVAVAAFVAGFVVLVIRMGDRPPRDDNDDGAVL